MAVKEKKVKSSLPVYAVGAVWVAYSLLFDLYRMTDFLIVVGISVIVYLTLYYTVPDKTVTVTVPDFVKSGDKTADDIVDRGNAMLGELLRVQQTIQHTALKASIGELHKTGTEIYSYIAKNPSSTPAIRKFHDYYFPETVKILKAYDEIDDFETGGKNISEAKEKIEKTVGAMTSAFHKQLDNLLYDKTFDVRTDIKVLESLLAEEGLSERKDG